MKESMDFRTVSVDIYQGSAYNMPTQKSNFRTVSVDIYLDHF